MDKKRKDNNSNGLLGECLFVAECVRKLSSSVNIDERHETPPMKSNWKCYLTAADGAAPSSVQALLLSRLIDMHIIPQDSAATA